MRPTDEALICVAGFLNSFGHSQLAPLVSKLRGESARPQRAFDTIASAGPEIIVGFDNDVVASRQRTLISAAENLYFGTFDIDLEQIDSRRVNSVKSLRKTDAFN